MHLKIHACFLALLISPSTLNSLQLTGFPSPGYSYFLKPSQSHYSQLLLCSLSPLYSLSPATLPSQGLPSSCPVCWPCSVYFFLSLLWTHPDACSLSSLSLSLSLFSLSLSHIQTHKCKKKDQQPK